MKKAIISIYLFITLIITDGCIHDCVINYRFEVPLAITPVDSILHIGDTLHVLMRTDNKALKDIKADRSVIFPNFDPNASFNLPMIDTFPVKEGYKLNRLLIDTSLYDVKIINTEYLGLGLFFLDIPKNDNESTIEFRVVLKTPGTYMLTCREAIYLVDHYEKIKFPGRCGKGSLYVNYKVQQGMNENILTENNKKVLKDYWKERSGDLATVETYYFRVVE